MYYIADTLSKEDIRVIIFFLVIFCLYKIGGPVWELVKTFFLILFAALGANFLKDEMKKWWDNDKK